ncbi:hypothetical protein [Gemmatimonas groenlandica]|uniref:Alpha/beta hydrolase n=1 Tax=Gemmatimonas groenlandica TaxID=2732249 RepID=A0A6M4ITJ8_9BACT|nr:hypothetical protein [Gemmatimonas groenlandica]QJR37545.1 hypothetical protein HKW67_19505 [Gemmatimonas groenlandica]
MWNSLSSRLVVTALCAAALGACRDITVPETASPALNAAQTPAATNLQFGDFALHVPANVHHVRGIVLALGGPDTRGFAVGTSFRAPPLVEPLLQDLGARFRELAAERGLAILGSGRFGPTAYPNGPASDLALLAAIEQAAVLTGRSELRDAPILLYGLSGGGPEASGFLQRNPERVAGLFLKVPSVVAPLSGEALSVPAYMVLAELDVVVNNPMLRASFAALRTAGAPWALAVEPGVPHNSLSLGQRELTIDWMRAILPLGNAGPFRKTSPQVGFLGDPTDGQIAPSHAFTGDLIASSWFPARPLATQWSAFIGK